MSESMLDWARAMWARVQEQHLDQEVAEAALAMRLSEALSLSPAEADRVARQVVRDDPSFSVWVDVDLCTAELVAVRCGGRLCFVRAAELLRLIPVAALGVAGVAG